MTNKEKQKILIREIDDLEIELEQKITQLGNLRYEERQEKEISKPDFPKDVICKEGGIIRCSKCGSTMSKSGFLGLFGKLVCDNKECENS